MFLWLPYNHCIVYQSKYKLTNFVENLKILYMAELVEFCINMLTEKEDIEGVEFMENVDYGEDDYTIEYFVEHGHPDAGLFETALIDLSYLSKTTIIIVDCIGDVYFFHDGDIYTTIIDLIKAVGHLKELIDGETGDQSSDKYKSKYDESFINKVRGNKEIFNQLLWKENPIPNLNIEKTRRKLIKGVVLLLDKNVNFKPESAFDLLIQQKIPIQYNLIIQELLL